MLTNDIFPVGYIETVLFFQKKLVFNMEKSPSAGFVTTF